jgi:hypothetical protein
VVIFGRQLGIGSDVAMVRTVLEVAEPFRSINTYGLFAVMTTTRPEIVLEGSDDGVNWKAYEFRYKPGALTRRPRWVAPFQPRVDWQMWFAALGSFQSEVWFQQFCKKVLEGSPSVATVFEYNPFPSEPPRFLRGELYQYRFAPRGASGWWVRERSGDYSPVLSVKRR